MIRTEQQNGGASAPPAASRPNRAARRQFSGVPKAERLNAKSRREFFAPAFEAWSERMELRRHMRALLKIGPGLGS